MFKSLASSSAEVEVEIDGIEVTVPAGVSIAAALLYLDRIPTRSSPVSGAPRAPFCMMGICFECLVEVNGVANQRACQRAIEAGMKLRLQMSNQAATG
jgi:predicted molibdopterin-dependent oxidoreductase YjgC